MIWYKARIIALTKKQVKAIKRKIYNFVDPHAAISIDSMFLTVDHRGLGIPDIDIHVKALQANRLNEIRPSKTWVKVAAPKIRMITRGTINEVNLNTITNHVNTDPPLPYKEIRKTVRILIHEITWGDSNVKQIYLKLYKLDRHPKYLYHMSRILLATTDRNRARENIMEPKSHKYFMLNYKLLHGFGHTDQRFNRQCGMCNQKVTRLHK